MLSSVQAYEILINHGVISKKQLVSFGENNDKLSLSSVSEPQNRKIQCFLGCELISVELTGCSVKMNEYTYGSFKYDHNNKEYPYSLVVAVSILTPFGVETRKNTLHFFNDNVLFKKGMVYTKAQALLAIADEYNGVFINTPYIIPNENLSPPLGGIADSLKSLEDFEFGKDAVDLEDYRFFYVPHRMIIEIRSLEVISSIDANIVSQYVSCYYHKKDVD